MLRWPYSAHGGLRELGVESAGNSGDQWIVPWWMWGYRRNPRSFSHQQRSHRGSHHHRRHRRRLMCMDVGMSTGTDMDMDMSMDVGTLRGVCMNMNMDMDTVVHRLMNMDMCTGWCMWGRRWSLHAGVTWRSRQSQRFGGYPSQTCSHAIRQHKRDQFRRAVRLGRRACMRHYRGGRRFRCRRK